MQNFNVTVTQTAVQTIERGKNILHLVLKRKPVTEQALEELEKEISERIQNFLNRIIPKLEKTKFENPEQAIKVIFLKGLINILKKLVAEYQKELSPEDQVIVNQIFANEENNIKLEESKMQIEENKTSIEEDIHAQMKNNNKDPKDKCSIQ